MTFGGRPIHSMVSMHGQTSIHRFTDGGHYFIQHFGSPGDTIEKVANAVDNMTVPGGFHRIMESQVNQVGTIGKGVWSVYYPAELGHKLTDEYFEAKNQKSK